MKTSEAQAKGIWPLYRSETLRNGMQKITILYSMDRGMVKYISKDGEPIPRLTRDAFYKECEGYSDWSKYEN